MRVSLLYLWSLPVHADATTKEKKAGKDKKKRDQQRQSSFPSLPVTKLAKQIEVRLHNYVYLHLLSLVQLGWCLRLVYEGLGMM